MQIIFSGPLGSMCSLWVVSNDLVIIKTWYISIMWYFLAAKETAFLSMLSCSSVKECFLDASS